MAEIQVKALIDNEKNRVVFVESNADFVDMLFSFLMMPMGTIIKLNSRQPSKVTLGSMNNLYRSVQSLDVKYFGTHQCKEMLLRPRSGAEAQLRRMRIALQKYDYLLCCNTRCHKRLSYYKNASCCCGKILECPKGIFEPALLGGGNGGVFMKGLTRYLISDNSRIDPLSTKASLSLLSKRVKNGSHVEQRTFRIGQNEMLNLLKSLLG